MHQPRARGEENLRSGMIAQPFQHGLSARLLQFNSANIHIVQLRRIEVCQPFFTEAIFRAMG